MLTTPPVVGVPVGPGSAPYPVGVAGLLAEVVVDVLLLLPQPARIKAPTAITATARIPLPVNDFIMGSP
jgi:hypothetical protein